MALGALFGKTMSLNLLNKLKQDLPLAAQMPVLFLGHGSPMNAIEENEFVQGFRRISQEIEKPKAVLCISAHWETKGSMVTAMDFPKTIHDFGGFPRKLFEVQYPAPGSPELAKETQQLVSKTEIGLDHDWGLDHGAWSVIKHFYPQADTPIIQMSIDYTKAPQYHYELAQELSALRKRGVLIVGSGNIIHNLRMVAWDKLDGEPYAYDWAQEANAKMNKFILEGDHQSLVNFRKQGRAFDLAIPTTEHFIPLLYTLGVSKESEEIELFNDAPLGGSLSMTSVKIG